MTSLRTMFGFNSSSSGVAKGWKQSVRRQLSGSTSSCAMEEGGERKRLREDEKDDSSRTGSRTPTLVSSRKRLEVGINDHQLDHDGQDRPIKRFRGERVVVEISAPKPKKAEPKPQSGLVGSLPEDVLSHCLSFLNSEEDRFSLQTTCKQFRKISNSDKMLVKIKVGGDRDSGKNGIIHEDDTPESAAVALSPFSQAGNLEAIYMLGMIKSYCHQDVETGIRLLKKASTDGMVRSSYALGLVLRDSQPHEAAKYMKRAAGEGYLPALQELLPAREMKAKYGEPNADELRRHLDPVCLNLLLGRHYVHSAELRELNTSHCWNPLCGRWAFKANSVTSNGTPPVRNRRPWGYAIFRNGNNEAAAEAPIARTGNQNPIVAATRNAHAHNHDNSTANNANAGPRAGPADAETRVDSSGTSDESSSSQPGHHHHHHHNHNHTHHHNQNSTGVCSSTSTSSKVDVRVSRMKMCSRCCRAKYCSKLCQVYDWRSARHKLECQYL